LSNTYGGGSVKSISDITGSTGWYNFKTGTRNIPVYVNQDYSGGGWVLVMANRKSTAGMRDCSYYEAINEVNYRTEPSSNNGTNTRGYGPNAASSLADFNVFIGLKYWSVLAGRLETDTINVVQFAASTNGTSLTGTHSERWRWKFSSFSATYAMQSPSSVGADGSGTTTAPGMYGYHAVNGYNFTTYDNDQDAAGGNCATSYGNQPFWYGACWSGSMWGSSTTSHADGPHWNSSGGGDSRQYMAVYIK
jgi:hypothetical protein